LFSFHIVNIHVWQPVVSDHLDYIAYDTNTIRHNIYVRPKADE